MRGTIQTLLLSFCYLVYLLTYLLHYGLGVQWLVGWLVTRCVALARARPTAAACASP